MVLSFVDKFPRQAKIKPENKLVFIKALNPKSLIEEAQEVLMNLISVNGIFNVFLTKTKEL